MQHEAIAIDPITGIVYLTEDQETAGLYRFLPKQRGVLSAGGKLQMLAVRGASTFDAFRGQTMGERIPITWVDIANPDGNVFGQGRARGGARFTRLEGATFSNGVLFFTSTTGGDRALGQIWQLRVRASQRQRALHSGATEELSLLFESPTADVLKLPDNITVSPWRTLMVCEDNGGSNYLRGVTLDGAIYPFAHNITPGFETSELTGVCFSPDGATLFVNIQLAGATLAIWGPWAA